MVMEVVTEVVMEVVTEVVTAEDSVVAVDMEEVATVVMVAGIRPANFSIPLFVKSVSISINAIIYHL